jgi:murein DD-endopeptidase MepM/ murein hydrolase activator NlpD
LPAAATLFPSETPTAAPSPNPTPTETPAPPAPLVCAPLEGYDLALLEAALVVPFHPPAAGLDDPHHGVDLAEENDDHMALAGHGVQAALAGTVAMVTNDRFPYGNAVLIETPLEQIVSLESAGLPVPTLAPTLAPRSALTCPVFTNPPAWDASARSVYLLYAHLQAPVDLQVGDVVTCGQPLGAVGDSGNALNPHLHLEARFGPTGARLASMAHYDASASNDEMAAYCLWRVSGLFQMVDPMTLIGLLP